MLPKNCKVLVILSWDLTRTHVKVSLNLLTVKNKGFVYFILLNFNFKRCGFRIRNIFLYVMYICDSVIQYDVALLWRVVIVHRLLWDRTLVKTFSFIVLYHQNAVILYCTTIYCYKAFPVEDMLQPYITLWTYIKWRYCRFHLIRFFVHHVDIIDCIKWEITPIRNFLNFSAV